MPIPEGYKAVEEIAVELKVTYNRVQTAIKKLGLPQTVFADDRRRRFYSPDAVKQIKEWIESQHWTS